MVKAKKKNKQETSKKKAACGPASHWRFDSAWPLVTGPLGEGRAALCFRGRADRHMVNVPPTPDFLTA